MTELVKFTIIDPVGRNQKVPFNKLPRKLRTLDMALTLLTGVENIKDCPPHLHRVSLTGRNILNAVDEGILENQLPYALLRDHRGELRWKVGDCLFIR